MTTPLPSTEGRNPATSAATLLSSHSTLFSSPDRKAPLGPLPGGPEGPVASTGPVILVFNHHHGTERNLSKFQITVSVYETDNKAFLNSLPKLYDKVTYHNFEEVSMVITTK